VPKCSIVDGDAIAPRKLCLGDGSFSCPLSVRIHHAKRELKLGKKTRYLNSAAGFICGGTELESNAAECLQILSGSWTSLFSSSCTSPSSSSGSLFEDALFHEPLFQVFLLVSLSFVLQFFL
jgi:hypothetical protein